MLIKRQNILHIFSRGVREPGREISDRIGNTKCFPDQDGYPKISRFSNLLGFLKESGFPKELGLGTSLNNSLKPTPSTVSKALEPSFEKFLLFYHLV